MIVLSRLYSFNRLDNVITQCNTMYGIIEDSH